MGPFTPIVVKVGGSLYDLPGLGPKLTTWLRTLEHPVVLVPGGGSLVNALRDLDQHHGLGEEAAHWLALRALTVQAHFLATLLPDTVVVEDLKQCRELEQDKRWFLLDAFRFAANDEGQEGHLPHSWHATSDSIAARVARVIGASELILLKSMDMPADMNWAEASMHGFVDPFFDLALGEKNGEWTYPGRETAPAGKREVEPEAPVKKGPNAPILTIKFLNFRKIKALEC